jgi:hypothetical protein
MTTSAYQMPYTITPKVTPQVGELLAALQGEMGREALQSVLGTFRPQILPRALPQTGLG